MSEMNCLPNQIPDLQRIRASLRETLNVQAMTKVWERVGVPWEGSNWYALPDRINRGGVIFRILIDEDGCIASLRYEREDDLIPAPEGDEEPIWVRRGILGE